jgi:hypothetical protein
VLQGQSTSGHQQYVDEMLAASKCLAAFESLCTGCVVLFDRQQLFVIGGRLCALSCGKEGT